MSPLHFEVASYRGLSREPCGRILKKNILIYKIRNLSRIDIRKEKKRKEKRINNEKRISFEKTLFYFKIQLKARFK